MLHLPALVGLGELPVHPAPDFAPAIDPTLRTDVEAMLAAAGAWLVEARQVDRSAGA